jgi:hypothetical protein
MNNFLNGPAVPAPQPAGPVQIDGNIVPQQARPTRAPLQARSASPPQHNTSGIERAMAAEADRLHPPRKR